MAYTFDPLEITRDGGKSGCYFYTENAHTQGSTKAQALAASAARVAYTGTPACTAVCEQLQVIRRWRATGSFGGRAEDVARD